MVTGDDNEGAEDDCGDCDDADYPEVNPLRFEEEDERGGGGDNHETDGDCNYVDQEEVSRLIFSISFI